MHINICLHTVQVHTFILNILPFLHIMNAMQVDGSDSLRRVRDDSPPPGDDISHPAVLPDPLLQDRGVYPARA
jgi:hypothetical protein